MNINNLRDVDLNLLLVLLVVLEERNVTRAAERLGKTQSAISHALGRLRAQLGDELLVRAGGVMAPTPQAEALLPEVRQILDAVDVLLAPSGAIDPATISRTFQLAMSDLAAQVMLPNLLALAAREAPGASLRLNAASTQLSAQLSGQLHAYALDAACITAPEPSPGLIISPLLEERLVSVSLGAGQLVALPARAARALGLASAPLDMPPVTLALVYHERFKRDAAHRWLRESIARAAALAEGDRR